MDDSCTKRLDPLSLDQYKNRLSDVDWWAPCVCDVLRRHYLPVEPLEAGEPGTFPTFRTSRHVVKLFGPFFDGGSDCTTERAVYEVLAQVRDLPVPTLVASGELRPHPAGGQWPWPYLVLTRAEGRPWKRTSSTDKFSGLARQLGVVMRRVHALSPPPALAQQPDPLSAWHATCAERQRAWGTLPPHLLDQIEPYLLPLAGTPRRLVHADLHADHVFLADGRLTGLIDWADAVVCDPYYELSALHLGTFEGSLSLLREFLTGYGWEVGPELARRAMTMTLLHRFNVLDPIVPSRFAQVATLEELAQRLWGI